MDEKELKDLAKRYACLMAEDLRNAAMIHTFLGDWRYKKKSKRIMEVIYKAKHSNRKAQLDENIDELTIVLRDALKEESTDLRERKYKDNLKEKLMVYADLEALTRPEAKEVFDLAFAYAIRPYAKNMLETLLE